MLSQPPRIIICSPFGNLSAIGVKIIRNMGVNKACHLGNTVNPNKIINAVAIFAKAIIPKTIFAWSFKNFKNSLKAPLFSYLYKRPIKIHLFKVISLSPFLC